MMLNEYFTKLWQEFSEVQCASWIVIDRCSIERFSEWLKTGINDDAWS